MPLRPRSDSTQHMGDVDCVTGFLIKIYDRWGEKVYESTDENFCWDGIYKGQLLDPAVFVYYIQTTIEKTGPVAKKGNITLIR